MKRQHKRYSRPKKPFDKVRMDEENILVKQYGLKNKKEIWKADAAIAKIRGQAKSLIMMPEEQQAFLSRLIKMGLLSGSPSIDDALSLTKENILERRLQTIVVKKALAKTIKEARQLIAHRKIAVAGRIMTVPGHIVTLDDEKNIRRQKQNGEKA